MLNQPWLYYDSFLEVEPLQAADEGRQVPGLKQRVEEILAMPQGKQRQQAAAEVYDWVQAQPSTSVDTQPDDLQAILALAPGGQANPMPRSQAYDQVYGAWLGRCCGCLLGKPVEGWRRERLAGYLKEIGNYPITTYLTGDVSDEVRQQYDVREGRKWINEVAYMPEDDDTNYTLIGLRILKQYGRDFTPENVAEAWLRDLPVLHCCTAERVAYRNVVMGIDPPASGSWRNPFREWIGAQIRGDFFGYINPGNPRLAAEMAWRDACISHVKNGIYGEMLFAAMIAAAFVHPQDAPLEQLVRRALCEIPPQSRLAGAVEQVLGWYHQGMTAQQAQDAIHEQYDEDNVHEWCHTVSNAAICVMALLWGEGDFGRSISLAVETAFDTDCNGATVGSVLGAWLGANRLPTSWTQPLHDTLLSGVDGFGEVKISQVADQTLAFIPE